MSNIYGDKLTTAGTTQVDQYTHATDISGFGNDQLEYASAFGGAVDQLTQASDISGGGSDNLDFDDLLTGHVDNLEMNEV